MSKSSSWNIELAPFEVSRDLVDDVLDNPGDVKSIDGYQGHPITGLGDVYTPQPIVEFILDSIEYKSSNEIEKHPIIDLSCGTGSFVKSIVRRLRERMMNVGYAKNDEETARQVISTIRNNVVALDLNQMATLRTAQLIINELSQEIQICDIENPIEELRLYNTNSLHSELKGEIGQFKYIVCNPPYVRHDNIDSNDDKFYREHYETAVGKYDMYQLFFEQGIRLLKPSGNLGIVSPDRFHYTEYGKPLRNLIKERTVIEAIVNLEKDPFPVVKAYPSITILKKKEDTFLRYQYDNEFRYCEVEMAELEEVSRIIDDSKPKKSCTWINQAELGEDKWTFSPPSVRNLKKKLEEELILFKNSRAAMATGISTGADDIFILNPADKERIESDLLHPIVRGKNIERGRISNLKHILNPYSREGEIIDLDKYPEAKNYLEYHKSELKDRYCVKKAGKKWYETHASIDIEFELQRKIVTPDIASSAKFAVVEDCITHNTCYSITHPGELKAFAGFLSSSVFEFLLSSSMPKIESGYWRQMQRDFNELPVLQVDSMSKEARENLKTFYENNAWDRIDSIIYDQVGLSPKEQSIMESYL